MTSDPTRPSIYPVLTYGDADAAISWLAGAFGFEPRHYELSVRIGELGLLPQVRAADPETMVVACGYSCREQIAQNTGKRAVHVAEVLAGTHNQ